MVKAGIIYLIEKIWTAPMENEVDNAVGYKPFGYADSEDEARRFCENGRMYTKSDCWAIFGEEPEYRYLQIEQINSVCGKPCDELRTSCDKCKAEYDKWEESQQQADL